MRRHLTTLLLLSVPLTSTAATCDVIGGGPGYANILQRHAGDPAATSFQALKSLVDAGAPRIFIPGDASIEVPNTPRALVLKNGQVLFGDRGIDGSAGGRLYTLPTDQSNSAHAVIEMHSDARITGLRIEGPSRDTNASNSTIGIQAAPGAVRVEVDNNEIHAWPWAGVSIKQSVGNSVHHNYLHDNIKAGLGYGVVVQNGNAEARISCNVFDANRHAIAGSGASGEGYVAVSNLVLNGGGRGAYHQFDMHASGDIGGRYVIATGNIFDFGRFGTSNRASVLLRGVPVDGAAFVEGNTFSQPWTVGNQTAVMGVPGAIDAPGVTQRNAFNVPMGYVRDGDTCFVQYGEQVSAVLCDAVSP